MVRFSLRKTAFIYKRSNYHMLIKAKRPLRKIKIPFFLCFFRNDYRKENRGGGGGSYSGSGYDRWSYEHSAPGANDTALNKLQHKYWVAKQVRLMSSGWVNNLTLKFVLFRLLSICKKLIVLTQLEIL